MMRAVAAGDRMVAVVWVCVIAIDLSCVAPVRAQTSGDFNLGIDHFGLEAGLPGLYITDMSVTDDGRLWLNASGQLVSFDGLEFETHDLDRFPSEDKTLRAVAGGRGDTLWVVLGQELYAYVRGRPSPRAHYDGLIRKVWQDNAGRIWAWDDKGALRLGDDGFERVVRLAPGGARGLVNGVRSPGRTDLWLHDPEPGSLRRINAQWVVDPLPFPQAWPIPYPPDRTFLSRTGGGRTEVTRLDGTPITSIPRDAGDWPFLFDSRGLVWTWTPGEVHAVGPAGGVVASLPFAPGERAGSALEDAEGDIWIGTIFHGVYRIHPRPVRVVGAALGLTDGEVLQVSAGPERSVLALDQQERVYRIGPDGARVIFDPSPPDLLAFGALTDRRGTTWISERRRDGDHLLGRTAAGRTIDIRAGIAKRIVESPAEDGVLWLTGAILRVRPYAPGGPVVEGPFLKASGEIRDLLVDPEGVAWAVGAWGLARIGPDGVKEFLVEDGFPTNGRSIHRSADGTIWIGRYSGGIVRYRDGKFGVVRAANGLWDDGVSSILEDDDGNLWMGSNRGVHRVARRELDAFLDGKVDRVHGRGYGADAGFLNAEASGWNAYRSPDGRMWFPTFGGVAVIDPKEALAQEQMPPGVRIRSVRAGSDLLEADAALTLPRGQRRIDVAYGAILLSGQEGVRYETLLDGVDHDWVDEGAQRQVTYGNLPPGRHVFRVRAVSGAGMQSREDASVALTVPPYFYETGSFIFLMTLLAAGALWLVYHLRVRQLRLREATLQRLVNDRTRDLARAQEETETALVTVEAQAKELRSLDEAKSRFFANVSHELRTPLTLVQGPLQDVMDGRLGPTPDAVREQVATVLASSSRLGELVEQLLDVARLESGEMRLHVQRQDLKPLLERLAASFGALARRQEIEFQASLPEGAVHATVDADQMEKVYGNLLVNAFKFTPEGGRVRFAVELTEGSDGEQLAVAVEDSGPGIPEEEQKRIFERFHQVDDSSRRVHGGAGLGLALVKEIAELHGGTVEVWSQPGRGSRFTVRVPTGVGAEGADVEGYAGSSPAQARAESPSARVAPAGTGQKAASSPTQTVPADAGQELASTTLHAEPSPPRTAAGTTSGEADDTERPTVLVVEDHDELRAYLRRHLEDHYRVVEARNGHEGLAQARRAVPDLILSDIMMPEMDGEELCRAVRADPELSFLPVIMVTARASRQSRLSSLEGGADDYLVKPFDPQELRLRVGNLLASRRRLAERLRDEGRSLPFVPLELPDAAPHDAFATRLDAVLRERMGDEDLDVDDMAKALAMSRSTLYRQADDALGASPMELLWEFRLKHAAHWLEETDATVSEVAYACGFKTVPHFTRRFKARFGTTPAAYRSGGE
jgi:signal transduction histidine kinase/DNA-binding response OmpR family regulator